MKIGCPFVKIRLTLRIHVDGIDYKTVDFSPIKFNRRVSKMGILDSGLIGSPLKFEWIPSSFVKNGRSPDSADPQGGP